MIVMEKQMYAVGDRVEKLCDVCEEERGHVVASVNKRGMISRVSCPKCGTRSTYKNKEGDARVRATAKSGAPYDRTRTYRAGQTMMHPVYGIGEVTAVIEPQKIDVLFPDRMRRLIHSRAQA
jgi:transcription elongation factor Elf1